MEPMDVFYQILHEDLNPLNIDESKEFYIEYLQKGKRKEDIKSNNSGKGTSIADLDIQTAKFLYYKNMLLQLTRSCKRKLHNLVLQNPHNTQDTEVAIQRYQELLLVYIKIIEKNYLVDELETRYQISKEKTNKDIFKLAYQTLDDILNYLETTFHKYLDHELPMSYQNRLWFVYKYKTLCNALYQRIVRLKIPSVLQEIIYEPLLKISSNDLEGFSYSQRDTDGGVVYVIRTNNEFWTILRNTKQ